MICYVVKNLNVKLLGRIRSGQQVGSRGGGFDSQLFHCKVATHNSGKVVRAHYHVSKQYNLVPA